LTIVNDAFNSEADLLSFIDNKRKNLHTEEHTPKPFDSDELKYFQEAQERVYEDLQKVSNKLTTTRDSQEPEENGNMHGEQLLIAKKKRKQKKGEKNKEKRLHQRAYMLLEKLTSKEVTEEIFDLLRE